LADIEGITVNERFVSHGLLEAYGEATSEGELCKTNAVLAKVGLRQTVTALMVAHPELKATNSKAYSSLNDIEVYQEWQTRFDQIENQYRAQCPKVN
jgi:hypothetical protein